MATHRSQPAALPGTRYSILFLLLLAALLRFYCLSCSSLWHDEGNTWALVQRGFFEIAQDSAADIHPPGFYWLLKLWTGLLGTDAWGVRSFSAAAGTAAVAVVYGLGQTFVGRRRSAIPLLAAFLAAVNPFQIFYSQEARMYALLMLESAILFWALLRWQGAGSKWQVAGGYGLIYLVAAAAGLWTHYIFPVVLAAAGSGFVWWLWQYGGQWTTGDRRGRPAVRSVGHPVRATFIFFAVNLVALLLYLPWLPTGFERLLSWPNQPNSVGLWEGLTLTLQTLTVGPIRSGPQLAWGWLILAGLIPLAGGWHLRNTFAGPVLFLWLLLPVGVMFSFGLLGESFLKFLLVASPAWCLLSAAVTAHPEQISPQQHDPEQKRNVIDVIEMSWNHLLLSRNTQHVPPLFVLLLAGSLALLTLPGYYTDPTARDNYAGMARTVAALGNPATDLVLLNAPGQADVWGYYDPGIDTLPVPTRRPPDPAETEALLARATANRKRLFTLFWATEQSDPAAIVETWLGRNGFKGLESWQGHVRFVTYSLASGLRCELLDQPAQFGDMVQLAEICLDGTEPAAGETLLVGLRWRPLIQPQASYKVTVQLLDASNQVIAQQDGEPAGGTMPTTGWHPGEVISDNHGLFLRPGTVPGTYRLIVALYDAQTGTRLPTSTGDAAQLAMISVGPPETPLPSEIVPMQHRINRQIGPAILVGYDFQGRGFAHASDTPVRPGEIVQVILYWQAPDPLPDDWPRNQTLRLELGDRTVEAPLVAAHYPTGQWQAGELLRGQFDIPFDGTSPVLWLKVGQETIRLGSVPTEGR